MKVGNFELNFNNRETKFPSFLFPLRLINVARKFQTSNSAKQFITSDLQRRLLFKCLRTFRQSAHPWNFCVQKCVYLSWLIDK